MTTSRESRPPVRHRPVLVIAGLLTLGLSLAIALNASPYLRGPDAWRWAYAIPGAPLRHCVPAIVLALYGLLITLGWRRLFRDGLSTRPVGWFLLLASVSTPVIQAALLFPESPDVLRPLFYRTVSAGASGVFTVGSWIDNLAAFLKAYPSLMPTFPVHPQRYPPGLPVLFYLARQGFERVPWLADRVGWGLRLYQCHDLALMRLDNATMATALIQMLTPVMAGLTIFPLYGLARDTVDKRAALLAVGLYPLVPSLALWSGRWDQAYPLLACGIWYTFYRGLTRDRYGWLAVAGLLQGISSFFSFGLVVLLMPLAITAWLWALPHPQRRQWLRLSGGACVFFAAAALPWAVYRVVVGSGFAAIWRVSMSYHLGLDRNSWVWLVYHLYDFLFFLGVPLAVLFVVALGRSVTRARNDVAVLPLAFGISLLILDLSGAARGEVARVWLFLTPFPVIAAAGALARWRRGWSTVLVLGLLAGQLLTLNAFLRVVTTGIEDPPDRVRQFSAPQVAHPVSATFGGRIALLGYDLESQDVAPGESVALTLYWRALHPISRSYTVFTHLRSTQGDLVNQEDGIPQDGRAPTTCWLPGEVIADTYMIEVPAEASSERLSLVTGLYVLETGERLAADGLSALPDDAVSLGTVIVR